LYSRVRVQDYQFLVLELAGATNLASFSCLDRRVMV